MTGMIERLVGAPVRDAFDGSVDHLADFWDYLSAISI